MALKNFLGNFFSNLFTFIVYLSWLQSYFISLIIWRSDDNILYKAINLDGPALIRVNIYLRNIHKIDDVKMVRRKLEPFDQNLMRIVIATLIHEFCIKLWLNLLEAGFYSAK